MLLQQVGFGKGTLTSHLKQTQNDLNIIQVSCFSCLPSHKNEPVLIMLLHPVFYHWQKREFSFPLILKQRKSVCISFTNICLCASVRLLLLSSSYLSASVSKGQQLVSTNMLVTINFHIFCSQIFKICNSTVYYVKMTSYANTFFWTSMI